MTHQRVWSAIAILAMAVLITIGGSVLSQEQPDRMQEQERRGQGMGQDRGLPQQPDREMTEKMKQAMQPGPEHKALQFFAGNWNLEITSFDHNGQPLPQQQQPGAQGQPGQPGQPRNGQVSQGTAESRVIFDGRYLFEHVRANVSVPGAQGNQQQRMEGICLVGYDNLKKQYTMVWVDNVSTSIFMALGCVVEKTGGEPGLQQQGQRPGQPQNQQELERQRQLQREQELRRQQQQPGQPGQPGQGQMQDQGVLQGKVIDFYGLANDPKEGKVGIPIRQRIEITGQNTYTVTMFNLSKGLDAKMLEIKYTRAEGGGQ